MDQSLDMAANLIDDVKTREKISQMKQKMAEGASFAESLMETQLFSGVYARMITVGFKTGSADAVMKKSPSGMKKKLTKPSASCWGCWSRLWWQFCLSLSV